MIISLFATVLAGDYPPLDPYDENIGEAGGKIN
jgi:hypothetical protein